MFYGLEFFSVRGRGGKGVKEVDRVEKLIFYVYIELRNAKVLKKCFFLRLEKILE